MFAVLYVSTSQMSDATKIAEEGVNERYEVQQQTKRAQRRKRTNKGNLLDLIVLFHSQICSIYT